jgi:hypothetical protein
VAVFDFCSGFLSCWQSALSIWCSLCSSVTARQVALGLCCLRSVLACRVDFCFVSCARLLPLGFFCFALSFSSAAAQFMMCASCSAATLPRFAA